MKIFQYLICLLICESSFAQNQTSADINKILDTVSKKMTFLISESGKAKIDIRILNAKINELTGRIDSLSRENKAYQKAISKTADDLGIRITETGNQSESRITGISESLSRKSLYGIIGLLSALVLSGLLFYSNARRQRSDKSDVEEKLSIAKKSIEEDQVRINTKLAELYNGQMELLRQDRKSNPSKEIDHSLALKVADEIVKMQMNLSHMDSKVRGHKQLSIAVGNVFDNFRANGYEIIDYLNKSYKEGMNMQATMEVDPGLKEGEQIITRIIRPEIHYNSKVIQHAQVIVSYGE